MSSPRNPCWEFLSQPAFAFVEHAVRERLCKTAHWPVPSDYRALAAGIPNAIVPWFDFVPQTSDLLTAEGGFDAFIARTSLIPTRPGSYHDLLGALAWLHFPCLKTAIHQLQCARSGAGRGPAENAATHFDESGVVVLSSERALFEALARLRWYELFWERRDDLARSAHFIGFGHGLLDALRAPHPRLMGKALLVRVRPETLELDPSRRRVSIDRALAPHLAQFLSEPARLYPLPVLGVPEWTAGQTPDFYRDDRYFRTARQRSRHDSPLTWIDLVSE